MQRGGTYASSAGLGASLVVAGPSHGEATVRRGAPGRSATNPAEVLAQLMDFPGGIQVAEQLQADFPETPRHPQASVLGERLLQDVEARVVALQRNALAPLVGIRAPAPPAAEELADAFRAAGLSASSREEAGLAKFSDMTGAPLLNAVGASIRQSQIQIGTLRWEILADLRELGPQAERIERLDGVLHTATQARVRDLFERLELSLCETWSAACQHALRELPTDPTAEDFAAWLASDGWLERFRDRCIRASQAVYTHLRNHLLGLVHAAVSAEEA